MLAARCRVKNLLQISTFRRRSWTAGEHAKPPSSGQKPRQLRIDVAKP
jgi:hypothetical protein